MDKNRIFENIEILLKEQNKKKGDLDEYLGHSKGYLNGIDDPDKLSWGQMNDIALFFGVPVENLVTYDYGYDFDVINTEKRINELTDKLKAEQIHLALLREQKRG